MLTLCWLYQKYNICPMSKEDVEFIGKQVKDMYGTFIGKVIGTITDIDGSVQTVGVDCGSEGLKQVPFEQLVVQGQYVIFIPRWRLDAQRLLREKGLTLRRIRALIDIVSENDDMKEDAELIHEKYKMKLLSLDETEKQIREKLENRLADLDNQLKSIRMLRFDAKLQNKSNEISDVKYELVKTHTVEIIEHIEHEKAEIVNIQRRINDLSVDTMERTESPKQDVHSAAVSYLGKVENSPTPQPKAPVSPGVAVGNNIPPTIPTTPKPVAIGADGEEEPQDSDWLKRISSS
ncbi:MAG TPA: CdvA-like protein [Candidatus Nitrosotalea sp.]|nr:CdvA-like protein [Candidatus Nitrosotalea sp.]